MRAGEGSGAELLLTGLALYGDGLLLTPLLCGRAAPVMVDSVEAPHESSNGLQTLAQLQVPDQVKLALW